MKYEGLTPNQYERVVELSKRTNKTIDELVDEIIEWCEVYNSIDEILNDYEMVNA